MSFIRTYINFFAGLFSSGFVLSWLLMAIVLPMNIAGIAESHTVYSIFNAEEGCFEMVIDHHEKGDLDHLEDEDNDAHSFHSSCCFDDLALTFKKQETDPELPQAYNSVADVVNFSFEKIESPVVFQEKPIPPPAAFQELRITRLLI